VPIPAEKALEDEREPNLELNLFFQKRFLFSKPPLVQAFG
jgi:hypothetical protein